MAVLTLIGSPLFYKMNVLLEIAATLHIVWYDLHWPKEDAV